MQNSTRIIVNTGILYGKMIIAIGLALFSTRLVLNALGASDFGIFALIGGVIGALSFLNKAMATATQRFLSYNRGKGFDAITKIFSNSLFLHIIIGLIFALLLEIIGIFLFDGFLNIPLERIPAAKFIFHCAVASTFFSVIGVPYEAIMNAKENMLVFSLFSILESVLKLLIAIFLFYTPVDTLETYGICMALMQCLCTLLKRIYSRVHYAETKINFRLLDKNTLKEMAAFTGWLTIEILSHIAKGEGIPIILNLFFGTQINASYGISTQVRHNISLFSEMIFKSSNPQVMRNIGEGNLEKSISLSLTVCKFSFLLMALISVPFIVEAPYVLSLWLKNYPDYTVLFCQIVLATSMIIMLARGLNFLIDGIGKIRAYRLTLTFLNLLVFPIAYGLLYLGMPPYAVFIGMVISDILVVVSRIYFACKYSGLKAGYYCKAVLFPLTFSTVAILILLLQMKQILAYHSFVGVLFTTAVSSLLMFGTFYFWVLNAEEKIFVFNFIKKFKSKFKRT